jgi:hypothetical protein
MLGEDVRKPHWKRTFCRPTPRRVRDIIMIVLEELCENAQRIKVAEDIV